MNQATYWPQLREKDSFEIKCARALIGRGKGGGLMDSLGLCRGIKRKESGWIGSGSDDDVLDFTLKRKLRDV